MTAGEVGGSDPLRLAVYSDARVLGGAEKNLGHLLAGLPASVQVTVLATDDTVRAYLAERRSGVGSVSSRLVARIEHRRQWRDMVDHARLLRRLRPDVIQYNLSAGSSCQWPMAVAVLSGITRVVAVENSTIGTWSADSRRLKRWTSPRLSAHVAVGARSARTVEEMSGLRTGSVGTLYHGVPEPDTGGREPSARAVVNIARHDPVKGVDVLLEAMARLPRDVTLTQIGDGPATGELEQQARTLGIAERVEFRPLPWERAAADELGGFALFVLSSRSEGLPVTVLEAMLAGLAVVATRVGSVDEAVTDGQTGLLVEPENPAALADAVRSLLDDPDRRMAMGRRGREAALDRFTVAATIAAYLDLYRQVMAGPRATAWRRRPVTATRQFLQ